LLALVLRRLGEALATLLGVLLLVFALLVMSPGDPARLALRGASGKAVAVSTEALSAFRATYGLDRPIPERFSGRRTRSGWISGGPSRTAAK
jgi:peptide/nickel transport system permease protein